MKILMYLLSLSLGLSLLSGCSSFQAERVDDRESDEKGLEITDEWLQRDTEETIKDIMKQINAHKGLKNYLVRYRGGYPKTFIGEVENQTSESYFPIDDLNEELLTALSASGKFILVDAKARESILKEITYQNDGMVSPETRKKIGRQTGADLMIFGSVHMKAKRRRGKTLKQYSVNIRMTDIERGTEVFRGRIKRSTYSKQSGSGW